MRYSTFEILAAIFGTLAIAGTVAAGAMSGAAFAEIVGQLLLLVILVSSLHFGRNGGFMAALFATAVYVGLRANDLAQLGLQQPLLGLLTERAAVYVVIGVLGGELCSRIKYMFLKMERGSLVDDETGVYVPSHLGRVLTQLIEAERRYDVRFSACILALDSGIVPLGTRTHGRTLVHEVASVLQDEVRAVDEVGRFSDHSFMVLFPNTPRSGGEVACSRLTRAVSALLERRGAKTSTDAVACEVLGFPEDDARLMQIAEQLTGEPAQIAPARAGRPPLAARS